MSTPHVGPARRRPPRAPSLLESLEARRFLSATGEPVREEFSGTTSATALAEREFHVKAGERIVFSASSYYDSTRVSLLAGDTYIASDNNYMDREAGLTYLATEDVTLRLIIGPDFNVEWPSSYRLDVTRFPPGYRDDAGDAPADAKPIDWPAAVIHGTHDWHDDEDWFSFRAEAGVAYRMVLSGMRFDTDYFTVHDAAGNDLGVGWSGGSQTGRFAVPATGDYFIRVKSRGVLGDYTLAITPIPDDHANVERGATTIKAGQTSGVITGGADVDVFRFLARPGKRYEFSFYDAPGLRLEFVGEGPAAPFTVKRYSHNRHVYVTTEKRWQYVRMRGVDLPAGADEGYRLSLTLNADDNGADGYVEPEPGQPIDGNLESAPDSDKFVVRAPSAGRYRLTNHLLGDDRRPLHVVVRRGRKVVLDQRLDAGARASLELTRGRYAVFVSSAAPGFDRLYELTLRPLD